MTESAPDAEPAVAASATDEAPRTESHSPVAAPRRTAGQVVYGPVVANRQPLRGRPMSNAELMAIDVNLLKSEEKLLVDNEEQRLAMEYTGSVLRTRFGEDTTVEEDMGLYYLPRDERGDLPCEEGDQRTPTRYAPYVVPDVMVAFGVPRERFRLSYQTWRMGKVPDFVLEVVSKSSARRDYGSKRELYERLGVAEYFIFDGRVSPGRERLTAYRLNTERRYEEVRPAMHEGVGLGIRSELLGLVAFVEGADRLGWWDPEKRERLLRYDESERDRKREREGRLREREARLREREARLRERDERLREREGREKAERDRDRERRGREIAEREVAELRAKLAVRAAGPAGKDVPSA